MQVCGKSHEFSRLLGRPTIRARPEEPSMHPLGQVTKRLANAVLRRLADDLDQRLLKDQRVVRAGKTNWRLQPSSTSIA